jgi:hypothetical protein
MVAGKSLPLFFVGTMLAAQSIDGNSSLGSVSLVYQFGFWAGAAIPIIYANVDVDPSSIMLDDFCYIIIDSFRYWNEA